MRLLNQKTNQSIKIGDNIEVRIIRSGGGRVSIGITAPDSVRILRGELADEAAILSDWNMIGEDFSIAFQSMEKELQDV